MVQLTGSVGSGGRNVKSDVLLVQRLLNGTLHLLVPERPLPEDGNVSPQLIGTITAFQTRVVHAQKPDGRIDAGGPTWTRLVTVSRFHPRPAHVQAFLDMAAPAAARVQARWRVPASVLLAQAAVESGWGQHVKGNAYFGIKGNTGTSGGIAFGTREVVGGQSISTTATFRAYASFEEAADDYGRFLNENARYSNAFNFTNDPIRFVQEVAKAGYATDPNYAATVGSVIQSFSLRDYDR